MSLPPNLAEDMALLRASIDRLVQVIEDSSEANETRCPHALNIGDLTWFCRFFVGHKNNHQIDLLDAYGNMQRVNWEPII